MKNINLIVVLVSGLIWTSCQNKNETMMEENKIDIQGHRGGRGLFPENTIPAFLKALELGVTTLELDLVVTKEKELLVSHDPYMSSLFCLDANGNEILKEDELLHNIYQMTYEEIKRYDVGTKFVKSFENQEKMKVHKPVLKELVAAVDKYLESNNMPGVKYNIELKSEPIGDNTFQPEPEEFSTLVYNFLIQNMDSSLVNIQSFDFRILKYFHENYPEIRQAVLIENALPIDKNLENLGYAPEIYSCYHHLLDSQKVNYLHSKGMKVIPWIVNEEKDIRQMIEWKVDGIITDYPDRVIKVISE